MKLLNLLFNFMLCRNSSMYKSFEERVGGAYTSVKVIQPCMPY